MQNQKRELRGMPLLLSAGVTQLEIYLHTPPTSGPDFGPPPLSLDVGLDGAFYFGQIQGNDDTVSLRRFVPLAN